MVDSSEQCREGWDPSELLAYLEGDLSIGVRRELEQHLRICEACSSELESLRLVDSMLTDHPQVFHPDEEVLYRYVSAGQDDERRVSAHLETCEQCREDAAILREMVTIGPNLSKPRTGCSLVSVEEPREVLPRGRFGFLARPSPFRLARIASEAY